MAVVCSRPIDRAYSSGFTINWKQILWYILVSQEHLCRVRSVKRFLLYTTRKKKHGIYFSSPVFSLEVISVWLIKKFKVRPVRRIL